MKRIRKPAQETKKPRDMELHNEDGVLVGTYKGLEEIAAKLGVATNSVSKALGSGGKIKGHTVAYVRRGLEFVRQTPSASMQIPRGVFGSDLEKKPR